MASKGITFTQKGDFSKTVKFFDFLKRRKYLKVLNRYGTEGVNALASATPKDSGDTAGSWSYEIVEEGDHISVWFKNSNVNKGVNIAIILQFGHGTRNGGYVYGRDYINPAIRPLLDDMAEAAWREVVDA